jgi:hypothetical protein
LSLDEEGVVAVVERRELQAVPSNLHKVNDIKHDFSPKLKTAFYAQKIIMTFVFKKIANFFAKIMQENCQFFSKHCKIRQYFAKQCKKSPKVVTISSTLIPTYVHMRRLETAEFFCIAGIVKCGLRLASLCM